MKTPVPGPSSTTVPISLSRAVSVTSSDSSSFEGVMEPVLLGSLRNCFMYLYAPSFNGASDKTQTRMIIKTQRVLSIDLFSACIDFDKGFGEETGFLSHQEQSLGTMT